MSQKSYELFKKYLDSEGMAFQNRMKSHSFSFNIFAGNYRELKEGLAIIENPEVGFKLMSSSNKKEKVQAHREINRLFHNYLAAAKTLIDHTRVFIEENYSNTTIEENYKSKIMDGFANDPLARFVQDLRNFMLHNGLPHSQMSISYVKDAPSIESSVRLETEKLKEWRRWTKPSRQFLNEQDGNLRLTELITPYSEKVLELYNWLESELYAFHEQDLQELYELQVAYNQMENDENVI